MAGRNFDYPKPYRGRMAKNALRDMAEQAAQLDQQLLDDDKLPAWVDYFIATASDRMNTVGNYMKYDLQRFKASTPKQQDEAYGRIGYRAQVMMRDYPQDNGVYGGILEDALDKIGDWTSNNEETQEEVKSIGRVLAYTYLLSMPIAAGVAYYRSQSVSQAVGAGLASTPYLLYVISQKLFSK